MAALILLAATIAAFWAPYIVQSIAQRIRYYSRSHGGYYKKQSGSVTRHTD